MRVKRNISEYTERNGLGPDRDTLINFLEAVEDIDTSSRTMEPLTLRSSSIYLGQMNAKLIGDMEARDSERVFQDSRLNEIHLNFLSKGKTKGYVNKVDNVKNKYNNFDKDKKRGFPNDYKNKRANPRESRKDKSQREKGRKNYRNRDTSNQRSGKFSRSPSNYSTPNSRDISINRSRESSRNRSGSSRYSSMSNKSDRSYSRDRKQNKGSFRRSKSRSNSRTRSHSSSYGRKSRSLSSNRGDTYEKNEKCKICSCWHPKIKCPFYPNGVHTSCRTCEGLHRTHACAYGSVKNKCLNKWGRFTKHGKTSLNTIKMCLAGPSKTPANHSTPTSYNHHPPEVSVDPDNENTFYSSSDNEDL